MRTHHSARVLLVLGLVAAIGLAAGCSKTVEGASSGTTQPAANVTSTSAVAADPASAGGTKASCDPAALVPVIQQKYGSAGVDQLVCLVPNAIVTVKTGGGDTVTFLVQQNGTWVVQADGPAANADALLPKDFPLSMLRAWQDKRNPPAPTTSAASGAPPRPKQQVCRGEGGDVVTCTVTTPVSTSTTRPPTTKPPTTPPTTPPSTPPTTFSQFCLENPLDPSCSGKK